MSKSFLKLLLSQLFANLGADIFLRVSLIANIYVITKSVIATSMVPILIGLSAFVASLLVPLVTKKLALESSFIHSMWKDFFISNTPCNTH